MIAMEKILQTLVKEVRKNGVFIERVDAKVDKLTEVAQVLDGKVSKLEITVATMDDRLIRVEMNQIADRERFVAIENRLTKVEEKR